MTLKRITFPLVLFLVLAGVASVTAAEKKGVNITKLDDRLKVEINGELFTELHFKDVPRPYFYPVIGPTGAGMTRNWPMKDVEGEDHDHVHHRGLWYAHFLVNGQDFWGETPKSAHIVHDKFVTVKSGKEVGIIKSKDNWVGTNGAVVLTDERTVRIYNRQSDRMLDFEITLKASNGEVVLGDEKDGAFATRVAESMRLVKKKEKGEKKAKPGEGHIVLSTGVVDDETWGKRADWCDYYGPVEGKTVGVAIFDHPENPRHPTWWHVRDYGLFAANPFGQHYFEKTTDTHSGDMTIPAGKSITFRYRIYWHLGNEKDARIAQLYQEYSAEPVQKSK